MSRLVSFQINSCGREWLKTTRTIRDWASWEHLDEGFNDLGHLTSFYRNRSVIKIIRTGTVSISKKWFQGNSVLNHLLWDFRLIIVYLKWQPRPKSLPIVPKGKAWAYDLIAKRNWFGKNNLNACNWCSRTGEGCYGVPLFLWSNPSASELLKRLAELQRVHSYPGHPKECQWQSLVQASCALSVI